MSGAAGSRLAVVVVTHNSAALLHTHFKALRQALDGVDDHCIVVVDSGSTDDSVDVTKREEPSATVISLAGNLGYAAGINAGMASVTARAWLILNPDTKPQPGSVIALLEVIERAGSGIAVPTLTDMGGRIQLSLRRRPTLLRALGEAVLGGDRARRWPALGEVVQDGDAYRSPGVYDWATGAAMCFSARCVEAVGTWDESFFLYSEETDFCLRAGDVGLPTEYVPAAVVAHLGGESNVSPSLYALLSVNRVRLYRKRAGPVRAAGFRLALILGCAIRAPRRSTDRVALIALLRLSTSVSIDRTIASDRR